MRVSRRLIDFNKQVLCGELGALLGTPAAPWLLSQFTRDPDVLSLAAVLGGLVTGSAFWLAVKIADGHKTETATWRALAGDIAFFTPAALLIGLVFYQPTLFFVTRHLIVSGHRVLFATGTGQFAAFSLFLLALNLYRFALSRWAGKSL